MHAQYPLNRGETNFLESFRLLSSERVDIFEMVFALENTFTTSTDPFEWNLVNTE